MRRKPRETSDVLYPLVSPYPTKSQLPKPRKSSLNDLENVCSLMCYITSPCSSIGLRKYWDHSAFRDFCGAHRGPKPKNCPSAHLRIPFGLLNYSSVSTPQRGYRTRGTQKRTVKSAIESGIPNSMSTDLPIPRNQPPAKHQVRRGRGLTGAPGRNYGDSG